MRKLLALSILLPGFALSQGYYSPLTNQGIDHTTLPSATSRALGGTSFGISGDPGTMFQNPASLLSIGSIQLSIGAHQRYTNYDQEQHYAPLKYYSNFSLLMEGLTGYIPDPDTSLIGRNPGDTVQRPFDTIGPNWSRSKNKGLPLQAMIAVPFTLGESKWVAGAGAVEYADLAHYYQNNNVLDPSVLSNRPIPMQRPPTDSLPIITEWSQFARSREGTIKGYGGALSTGLTEELTLGVSAMILKGSSDDMEQRVARGRLTFFTNYFRLDSVHGQTTTTGKSDFKAIEYTLSGTYRSRNAIFGFSVKPPMSMKRTFESETTSDTSGTVTTTKSSGVEWTKLPWRGTVGLAILPIEKLLIGLEYEIRPYESVVYISPGGGETNPWFSASLFHVGLQYTATEWLALRFGVRGQVEVFEPEGVPIENDPVGSTVYSGGAGFSYAGFRLNFAYEYSSVKYQDTWGSAISLNNITTSRVVADISYGFNGF